MASTWSALKIELLETGQNSGTWGTLTNVNLGDAVLGEAITGSATVDFPTDADVTVTLTDSATSQSARNLRLNITESSTGIGSIRSLILGSGCQIEKFYLINNTGTGAKTVKNTTGTGISVPAGKATLVYNNGTNVVDAASYFTSLTLGSALPVASGGTGVTTSTGTTNVVLSNSPTLVTPALGTPSALVGTNITGTATAFTASNVTTNANLTGAVTSVGNAASLGSFTSLQLLTALTDETGTGAAVFATSPTLVTPALGTPSALVGTNITGTATAFTASNVTTNANLTGGVTSVGNAATVVTNANLTGGVTSVGNAATVVTNANLTGDITSVGNATTLTNAPVIAKVLTGYVSGAGTVAATDSILQAIQKLDGNNATSPNLTGAITSVGNATSLGSFTSAQLAGALTDETGTGVAVFATSPTLVTPALGTPSSGTVTNLTGTASININGTVGATTATTGAFTSVTASTTLGVTGVSTFAAGTAALPSLTTTGDTNTGIFFPAADTLGFTTGGSERYRIASDGKQTTTGYVQVDNSTANAAFTITNTGAGNSFVVEDSANPDVTPFLVDASGNVVQGYTTAVNNWNGAPDFIASHSSGSNAKPSVGLFNWSSNTARTGSFNLYKSVSNSLGTQGIVGNLQQLGRITFSGDDGVTFIRGAEIDAYVDGTPGLNDMPGGLRFSTTADGASTPTERVRIDAAGNVGIGGTASADSLLGLLGTYKSSAAVTRVVRANGTIPSATTGTARTFSSEVSTEAAAFTLSNLQHVYANQSTIGAGSAVTNQFGFLAESTLTGAANNYGVYSNIAAAANRFNFYAQGTAANLFTGVSQFAAGTAALPGITQISDLNTGIYFPAADTLGFTTGGAERVRIDSTGQVGIGGTPVAGQTLSLTKSVTGGTTANVLFNSATIASDVTSVSRGYFSSFATVAAAFTLATLEHFRANQSTIGAGSAVTQQFGFNVDSTLTGATSNYGYYSSIASGTNRFNFYASGTAANFFAGNVGIGAALTNVSLYNTRNISGNTQSYGNYTQATIQSDVTSSAIGHRIDLSTVAAAFTLPNLYNFYAGQGTIGAASAVTNQYGFIAESTLTGATNNYGFFSNIAAAANRFNFYAAGTADNFFNGSVGIGAAASAFSKTLIGGTLPTSSLVSQAVRITATIPSGSTTSATIFESIPITEAAAFTLSNLLHFSVNPQTFGAGSTVTNQQGFTAATTLTGATNNYGFYSNIASGTNRFNFYANGTAPNYFAGSVGIGSAPASGYTLDVYGTAAILGNGFSNGTLTVGAFNGVSSVLELKAGSNIIFTTFNGSFGERFRISTAGSSILGIGTAIPAGGTAGFGYCATSTANFGVFFGSGAPTLSAAKGSLYLRSDGSTTTDRMYVNTNGSTTWTNVVTSA